MKFSIAELSQRGSYSQLSEESRKMIETQILPESFLNEDFCRMFGSVGLDGVHVCSQQQAFNHLAEIVARVSGNNTEQIKEICRYSLRYERVNNGYTFSSDDITDCTDGEIAKRNKELNWYIPDPDYVDDEDMSLPLTNDEMVEEAIKRAVSSGIVNGLNNIDVLNELSFYNHIITADEIQYESVEFLFTTEDDDGDKVGRFPKGYISMINGEAGVGKSQIATKIIAEFQNKNISEAFGTVHSDSGRVIIFTGEDGASQYKARLVANGVTDEGLKKITIYQRSGNHLVESIEDPKFEQYINQWKPEIVVIDPLSCYTDDMKITDSRDSRRFTDKLQKIFQDKKTACILIGHFNKGTHGTSGANAHIEGSHSLRDACKHVEILGRHPEDKELTVIANNKANFTNQFQIPSIVFSTSKAEVFGDKYPVLDFEERTFSVTADDISNKYIPSKEKNQKEDVFKELRNLAIETIESFNHFVPTIYLQALLKSKHYEMTGRPLADSTYSQNIIKILKDDKEGIETHQNVPCINHPEGNDRITVITLKGFGRPKETVDCSKYSSLTQQSKILQFNA